MLAQYLSFGLWSAPQILSAVADAFMYQNGISYALHYLDDILFAGEVSSSACGANFEQALSTCRFLGVPVAPDKVHGPARVITFLGIEIGTNVIQLCLPESKVSANTKRVCVEVFMYQTSAIVSNWLFASCGFFCKAWTHAFLQSIVIIVKYYKVLNCSAKTLFTSLLTSIPLGVLTHECTA